MSSSKICAVFQPEIYADFTINDTHILIFQAYIELLLPHSVTVWAEFLLTTISKCALLDIKCINTLAGM